MDRRNKSKERKNSQKERLNCLFEPQKAQKNTKEIHKSFKIFSITIQNRD